MKRHIEFADLKAQYAQLKLAIDGRIQRVLDHGQFIMGPEVVELEQTLARFVGVNHCITVASGTEALLIALMALEIGPGDEVITTPFSFVATAEVVALLGATPVFVDIEEETCNIDHRLIEKAVTSRTKAIMPVSLYGQPSDMDEICEIADRHGLHVIEDGAQSFGALYKGRRSGNLCEIGCTSFFPSKPLGSYGDGGAIFTTDEQLAGTMREIRVHGQSKRYYHTRLGLGGRMDTLQCAVVLAKMESFEDEVQRRICLGRLYDSEMASSVKRITVREDRTSVYAQYTILVDDRDGLQNALRSRGIPTAIHYPRPINEQPAYRDLGRGETPRASRVSKSVLSLPFSAALKEDDLRFICSEIRHECGEARFSDTA